MHFPRLRRPLIILGMIGLSILLFTRLLGAGEPSEVCVSSQITMINVPAGSCLGMQELSSMMEAPVLAKNGRPVRLKMTQPNSITTMMTIKSCTDYIQKVKQGWYSLSQRDMDRESLFSARCGLLTSLARARTPRHSHIDEQKGLANIDWLPSSLLPEIEEFKPFNAEALAGSDVQSTSVADLVATGEYTIKQATQVSLSLGSKMSDTSIHVLARADFNGDGYEDMLVMSATRMKEGTAGFSQVQGLTRRRPQGLLESFSVEIR